MASQFGRNVLANLFGTGWMAAVQLAITPIVVWKVGVGAYGLVGFYAALLAVLAVLDLGFPPMITRSMARLLGTIEKGNQGANVLRTFEILFAASGCLLGAMIAALSPWLARHWLKSSVLTMTEIGTALSLMGLLFAFRWMLAPYVATLQGLQRQVTLSAANAGIYTLTSLSAVASLWVIRPSISVFFATVAAGTFLQVLVLRWLAWRSLPGTRAGARFRYDVVRDGWSFSKDVLAISITAVLLTQLDKVVLTKLVPLEEYGLYAMAQTLAMGLYIVITPIFNAVYPRLCELATGNAPALRGFFASAGRLMSAIVVPTAVFMILFAFEIVSVWTRSEQFAPEVAPLFMLLVLGTAFNGLMNPSYGLQLALGHTRIGLAINLGLCLVLIPSIFYLTLHYGVIGGATVSPILNGLYLIVGLPITYRMCLGSSEWPAFYRDMAYRVAPSVCLLAALRLSVPLSADPYELGLELLAIVVIAIALAVALTLALHPKELQELTPGRK